MVLDGYYPEATKQKSKCLDCCYKIFVSKYKNKKPLRKSITMAFLHFINQLAAVIISKSKIILFLFDNVNKHARLETFGFRFLESASYAV